ncbi:MAG: hypothetical protein AB7G11_13990 [Phycisphaerales bacterium]
MPRGVKRRAKTKFEWTREQRRQLLTGHEFFGTGFGRSIDHPTRPLDLDLARQAWTELRDELLPEFIREHPFSRPWGWWRFDAPEARREAEEESGDDAGEWLGSPSWWATYRERTPGDHPSRGCESFRAYLTRLGLLTPEELQLVKIERHRKANPV